MQKQDKAFSAWLNHVLAPSEPAPGAGACDNSATGGALAQRRLAAAVKGAMVACYR